MYFALARRASLALALGTVALFSTDAALAGCSSQGKTIWQLPLKASDMNKSPKSVFSRSEFNVVSNSVIDRGGRLRLQRAPDGTPAIMAKVLKGENKETGISFAALKSPGIQHACLTLKVYLSRNFDFDSAGTKLGWGLWGGSGSRDSGGVPPELQKGWTVRNVTSRWGTRIYSYHLNRNKPRSNQSRCAPYGCMFGENSGNSPALASGRWVNVELEVRVNDLGKRNGYSKMWIDGKLTGQLNNQVFRTSGRNWMVRGMQFTDMWGGTTSARKNFSPKAQSIWYAGYKIKDMSKSGTGGLDAVVEFAPTKPAPSVTTPSTTSSNSRLSAMAPKGTIGRGKVELVWNAAKGADKYQIKLVDRKDKKTLLWKTLSPAAADCRSSNVCRYVGPSLGAGRYQWNVRSVDNGKKSAYVKTAFAVKNGATTTTTATKPTTSRPATSSVVAVAPSGQSYDKTPTLRWRPDSDADKYFVKIVGKDRGSNVKITQTVKPSSCTKKECRWNAPRLAKGNYEWMVRDVTKGKKGAYRKLRFRIR